MTERSNLLKIDGERLWRTIDRSGEIGPGRAGGLSRLALQDSDREMRDQFVAWCRDARLDVSVDGVGNIFARRAGADDSLPPILVGSHLDTQAAGGRYDGILGVLAGLEILRTLEDNGVQTRRPVEVVNWTNEEGARFQPPMMCSAAFAGVMDVDQVLATRDDEGISFGDELRRIGYAGETPVGGREVDSYFELHIEQGPELEAEGLSLGIVSGGYASRGMHIDVHGETAHSGPTPMDKRRNALIGASMLACVANDIGWKYFPPGKSAVPRMLLWPNKSGILPSYAQLTVDFRHPDKGKVDEMVAALEAAIPDCATRANVDIEIVRRWTFGAESFDADCIALVEEAAGDLGVGYKKMLSQAGHDAYHMSRVCPTTLLFSPCHDGITHNESEHIEPETTVPAVEVLMNAVLRRAQR